MRTIRDPDQHARRAMRMGVAGALALGLLAFAGLALGAASFSDAAGDDNAAPDLTSVVVSEAPDGTLTLTLGVANYQTLPANSWFNLWFDLDSNPETGDAGDEALVRYTSDGAIDFYLWNGSDLVQGPSAAMTGSYAAGVLTVTAPESAFGGLSTFGLLAVSARGQPFGDGELIASDYAPNIGRSRYVGPAAASFPDPGADHDAAPDITSVRVTDAKDGWISFAISTPNYATLPGESLLFVEIDRDDIATTGDAGAEVLVTSVGGEVQLEHWDARRREWFADDAPTRARVRNSGNVITIDVHRSELGNTQRFGFSVIAADYNVEAESVLAIDFAPDEDAFYSYNLVNKPSLLLTRTRLFGTPARPRAGKPFAINMAVRRSDTNRGITSGQVTCRVLLDGKPLRAKGSVVAGAARCSSSVPANAAGGRLRGTIAVRVSGKTATATFAYVVR